jgi:hypothetical protein
LNTLANPAASYGGCARFCGSKFLYTELSKKLNSEAAKVSKVKVCETPGAGASYWEE